MVLIVIGRDLRKTTNESSDRNAVISRVARYWENGSHAANHTAAVPVGGKALRTAVRVKSAGNLVKPNRSMDSEERFFISDAMGDASSANRSLSQGLRA